MPITIDGTSYALPADEYQAQKVAQYNAALIALAGSITVRWARAYHNADQSISNATSTAIALNSERYDTDVIHDNSTNNSRLTCKTAGLYLIVGHISYAANATGIRKCAIRLNGTTYIANEDYLSLGASLENSLSAKTLYPLVVNDYVEMIGYQDSGGSLNVLSRAQYSPEFMMVRLGS